MSEYNNIVFNDTWPDGSTLSGNINVYYDNLSSGSYTATGEFTTSTAVYTQFFFDTFTGPASGHTPTLISINGYISDGAGGNYVLQMDYDDVPNVTSAGFTEMHDEPGAVHSVVENEYTAPITSTYVVCYRAGTTILTGRGPVAVEHLAIGDLVVTASGARRPIRWLGSRTIDCASHPDPREVWPVRIAAHAFGDNRPARDLFVSPDHAIAVSCVDEVLIPAARLINGSTVARHAVDTVTYWHVELDAHDILLAEGLPSESYLDVGNRGFFDEGGAVTDSPAADPKVRTHADFCRPFVDGGPILDAVRLRLAARAHALRWTERHDRW